MSDLDIVSFPNPVEETIKFLLNELSLGLVDVGAVLPERFSSHVLVFATSTDIDLVTRRTRYVLECRADTDAGAAALAEEVSGLMSAWCRSGWVDSPSAYSLLSLVDSFPDLNKQPRAIVTCEVYWARKVK